MTTGVELLYFLLGLALGSLTTWLYLMNRHAGRPVDWTLLAGAAVTTFALAILYRLLA